jgi:hypothetical protein
MSLWTAVASGLNSSKRSPICVGVTMPVRTRMMTTKKSNSPSLKACFIIAPTASPMIKNTAAVARIPSIPLGNEIKIEQKNSQSLLRINTTPATSPPIISAMTAARFSCAKVKVEWANERIVGIGEEKEEEFVL